jgi:hypothetical protein
LRNARGLLRHYRNVFVVAKWFRVAGKENLTCFAVAGGEAWTGGQGTMVFACFVVVDEAVVIVVVIIICNPSVWRQLRLAIRELAEKRLSTTLSSSCAVSISLAV